MHCQLPLPSPLTHSANDVSRHILSCSGYIQLDQLQTTAGIEAYIVPSTWGNSAGLVGALTLAQLALDPSQDPSQSASQPLRSSRVGLAWRLTGMACLAVAMALTASRRI